MKAIKGGGLIDGVWFGHVEKIVFGAAVRSNYFTLKNVLYSQMGLPKVPFSECETDGTLLGVSQQCLLGGKRKRERLTRLSRLSLKLTEVRRNTGKGATVIQKICEANH